MNLTDGIISLRALEPEDVDILYGWENDTDVWDDGATLAPFSRALLADYVANYEPDIFKARQLRLMITISATGETVGTVDLYDFDPRNQRCGVGILVDTPHRRLGYATAALRLLKDYCGRHLGFHQLYSITGVDNTASRQAFQSAGFKVSGRLRSWIRCGKSYRDAYVMQLLL
ncbi:MAG: GNAT family N-acetyltransferase [Duncaniella sp.]|nr:GNAT family N-acetyltransferase [Duncaniella sp.]